MRASKIVLGALVAAALPLCGLADDSYIFWLQIAQPVETAVSFNFARMAHAEDMSKSYLTSGSTPEEQFEYFAYSDTPRISMDDSEVQYMDIGKLSDYDGKSFIIELFLLSGETMVSVAQSGVISFDSVRNSIALTGNDPQTPAKISAFSIPEPTGGLLMLLGLAALGLKRKTLAENMI